MLTYIYTGLVTLIILFTIILIVNADNQHKYELKRISYLEKKIQDKNNKLNYNRLKTKPCHISGLNNPRECYIESGYKCKWNMEADRCNMS